MKLKLTALLLAIALTSCTENKRAKSFGGTTEHPLEVNQKLVTVTFKDSNLWFLTSEMRADEVAETYTFKEKSNFGFLEGTVIIQEYKK